MLRVALYTVISELFFSFIWLILCFRFFSFIFHTERSIKCAAVHFYLKQMPTVFVIRHVYTYMTFVSCIFCENIVLIAYTASRHNLLHLFIYSYILNCPPLVRLQYGDYDSFINMCLCQVSIVCYFYL